MPPYVLTTVVANILPKNDIYNKFLVTVRQQRLLTGNNPRKSRFYYAYEKAMKMFIWPTLKEGDLNHSLHLAHRVQYFQ